MRTPYDPAEAARIAVERQTCESCGAMPSWPCKTFFGEDRQRPHEARLAVAHIVRDLFSVACPRCGAEPGQPCVSYIGGRACDTHVARQLRAAQTA
jgi:hypothetical protein